MIDETLPNVLSLYSGIGGMDLGFVAAGYNIPIACDIDPDNCIEYRKNFTTPSERPKIFNFEVKHLPHSGVLENLHFDVVIGGIPCQGFSQMGKQDITDPRNQEIFNFLDVVKMVNPKVFLIENVPTMASPKFKSLISLAMIKMKELGYHLHSIITNSKKFGVPQDRKRLFWIGVRNQKKDIFTSEYVRALHRMVELPDNLNVCVGTAINDLYDLEEKLNDGELAEEYKNNPPKYSDIDRGLYAQFLDEIFIDPSNIQDPQHSKLRGLTLTKHTEEVIKRFKALDFGETDPISKFKKLDPHGVCNTLRAGTGRDKGYHTAARPIHPIYPRVLNVRECARLHSFPDWFQFSPTKMIAHRQIGNSLPPLMSYAIAKLIKNYFLPIAS